MRRQNIGMISGVVAVVAIVLVLTVVWAAFSTTLTIKGSATVTKSSWGIVFQNLQTGVTGNSVSGRTTTATITTAPTITGNTTLGTFVVSLKTPGDYVSWEFDIKNTGSFPAKITTFTKNALSCTKGASGGASDATNVCGKLTYSLAYKTSGSAVAANDTLAAGETKTVVLKLQYADFSDTSLLPSDDVTVTVPQITITYSQV